jgi:hypothetical protein
MRVLVKKSSRTIHGNKHLQATLTESAWGASRKKDGYFKQKYQKLLVRKGSEKAIVAVAHKIIIAAYQVIKKKEAYKSPLLDDTKFNEKYKQKEIQKTIVKMNKLGFTVRITPII